MKMSCFIILVILALFACDDVFENNISKDNVRIVAPMNNAVAKEGDVTFCWRELLGATRYRVTVVSPSFVAAAKLVIDTVINTQLQSDTTFVWGYGSKAKGVKLAVSLSPGNYQWSICAFNSGYTSKEQVLTLVVEESISLE